MRITRIIGAVWLVATLGMENKAAERKHEPKTVTVLIKGFAFQPARVEVAAGDSVVWQNQDIVPHTATANQGFDSKGIDPQKSWSFVARKRGNFPYICSFHPAMKGELIVK